MSFIFCLMGKSSSGKDSVYRRLLADGTLKLERLVTGTTRPIREGEHDGVEYDFYTDAQLEELERDGKIIECRKYHTAHGIWYYFTVAHERMDVVNRDYITINTLEAYTKLRAYYGSGHLIPIYLEVEDGERLKRALEREMGEARPGYKEMCRRFLADEEDFSRENLEREHIKPIFQNVRLDETVVEIAAYIRSVQKRVICTDGSFQGE